MIDRFTCAFNDALPRPRRSVTRIHHTRVIIIATQVNATRQWTTRFTARAMIPCSAYSRRPPWPFFITAPDTQLECIEGVRHPVQQVREISGFFQLIRLDSLSLLLAYLPYPGPSRRPFRMVPCLLLLLLQRKWTCDPCDIARAVPDSAHAARPDEHAS